MKKVPNSISTRLVSGSSLRDGRRAPLSGSPAVVAVQLQNSARLAAASKVLAAFRVSVEKLRGMQPAANVEEVPFRYDLRRVRALHAASNSRSEESSAEEVVTSSGTSAQPPSGALAAAARAHRWAQL